MFSPKFDSHDDLQKFILTVFNILESITPTMRFTNINFTPNKMSCELIEVSRENDAVWRKVQIDFKNNKIEKLVTINPKMNTTNTIEL